MLTPLNIKYLGVCILLWFQSFLMSGALIAQPDPYYSATWNPQKDLIAVSDGYDLWLYDSNFNLLDHGNMAPSTDHIFFGSLAWSPDGEKLATYYWSEESSHFQIWDSQSLQVIHDLNNVPILGVLEWNFDSTQILTAAALDMYTTVIRVYDVNSGAISLDIALPEHAGVRGLKWIGDGQQILAGITAGTFIWDISINPPASIPVVLPSKSSEYNFAYDASLNSVAFTPLTDSEYLNQIQIWDLETQQLTDTLSGHTGGIIDVSWGPVSLLSVDSDDALRIWDNETWQSIVIPVDIAQRPSLDWNPQGTQFIVISESLGLHIRDGETGAVLAVLGQPEAQPTVTIDQES
jgi:WD40 repeat protein